MKVLKIIACLLLIVSAMAYALSWQDFGIAVKTKTVYDVVQVTDGSGANWLVATGGDVKSKIQFLGGTTPDTKILLDNVGAVSAKGITDVDTLAIGTVSAVPDGSLADFMAKYQPNGTPKGVAFKLKGVIVGTVLAKTLKNVAALNVGSVAGGNPKGVNIVAAGSLGGKIDDTSVFAYIGVPAGVKPDLVTTVKGLKAKQTAANMIIYAGAAKPAKTKIAAKQGAAGAGIFAVNPGDWSPKSSPIPQDAAGTPEFRRPFPLP